MTICGCRQNKTTWCVTITTLALFLCLPYLLEEQHWLRSSLSNNPLQRLRKNKNADILKAEDALAPFRPKQSLMTEDADVRICTVIKDEESYLEEWLDYYRLLGFSHVYLYDNSDDFVLRRYPQWYEQTRLNATDGIGSYPVPDDIIPSNTKEMRISSQFVTVLHRPGFYQHMQEALFNECAEHLRQEYSGTTDKLWIAFYDADEFLVFEKSYKYSNIQEFLKDYGVFGGSLQINWQVFGTSGEETFEDKPVTRRFPLRKSKILELGKALVKLDDLEEMMVHMPYQMRNHARIHDTNCQDGEKKNFWCFHNDNQTIASLHHFRTKSVQEFKHRRCQSTRIDTGRVPLDKNGCMEQLFVGDTFDDRAWQFLKSKLPTKYARYGEANKKAMLERIP